MKTKKMFKAVFVATCSLLPAVAHAGSLDRDVADQPGAPASGESSTADAVTGEPAFGEILVTARRRLETVRDVPLAITAADQSTLDRHNISDISGLVALTPSVHIAQSASSPVIATTFIRGIGTRSIDGISDSPVVTSIDGVYLASIPGSLIDVFDVDRIEVLRGPQGTLEGRNAPAGAINVVTARPRDEFHLRGEVGFGRFDEITGKVAVDGPIAGDALRGKLAVVGQTGGNFIKNTLTGKGYGGRRYITARGGLLFAPSSNFESYLTANYTRDTSPMTAFHYAETGGPYPARQETGGQVLSRTCSVFGYCSPLPRYTVALNRDNNVDLEAWGVSNTAVLRSDFADFTSVTGYRKTHLVDFLDLDALPIDFVYQLPRPNNAEQFSQEVRMASSDATNLGGRLNWVVGGYYIDVQNYFVQNTFVAPTLSTIGDEQWTKSRALFAHADFNIVGGLGVTFGARQTWDRKKLRVFVPNTADKFFNAKWNNLSIEAGAQYKWNNNLIYFRYSEAYKSGGFNFNGVSFDSEFNTSYEVGLKATFLDRRASINLTGFHYDYDGLQRGRIVAIPTAPGFAQLTTNAAQAKMDGIELELALRPSNRLSVSATVGYLDSRYKTYNDLRRLADGTLVPVDNSRLRLPYSPKWTLTSAVDYTIPINSGFLGDLQLGADVRLVGDHTVSIVDSVTGNQDGYVVANLKAKLSNADNTLSLSAYANNIFGAYYKVADGQVSGLTAWTVEGLRATYGVRLAFNF